MYTEENLHELRACQLFFKKSYEALKKYGVEGLSKEYADFVDDGGKLLFIVSSLDKGLENLESRMLRRLSDIRAKKEEKTKPSVFDIALLIAARQWVYELGRMYYICPRSEVARFMAREGFIDMSLSKNGNDYVERSWRIFQHYLERWMRIIYEISTGKQ